MSDTYKLIQFPEVQEYMEYDWFRKEAYLCQAIFEEQKHIDSAYFIPINRINEVNVS